ncbi:hypothetical protein DAI22_10g098100 [Oryza sativa Japonica Group]|jgi:hypothetical protein|nr:hypothetical protein DAI22_10g098100 [Oryza sativa Japonica Group]
MTDEVTGDRCDGYDLKRTAVRYVGYSFPPPQLPLPARETFLLDLYMPPLHIVLICEGTTMS